MLSIPSRRTVTMPVVNVGEMRVRVLQRLVNVRVSVWFSRINTRCVPVLMMLVVGVAVRMFQVLVRMLMFVLFGQV